MVETTANTFLYFAYGSNLLKKRIHINTPSAQFVGIGKLENHSLDFIRFSQYWNGCAATIVPSRGFYVWGAIWRLNSKDMPALDRQEGVHENLYFFKNVEVIVPDGKKIKCRTYQQTVNPPPRCEEEEIPEERWPSKTYMEVIINGAKECKLPKEYIQKLKNIPHNGKSASAEILELKGYNVLIDIRI